MADWAPDFPLDDAYWESLLNDVEAMAPERPAEGRRRTAGGAPGCRDPIVVWQEAQRVHESGEAVTVQATGGIFGPPSSLGHAERTSAAHDTTDSHTNGIGCHPYFAFTCDHSHVCNRCGLGNWAINEFHSVNEPINSCIIPAPCQPCARDTAYTARGCTHDHKPASLFSTPHRSRA